MPTTLINAYPYPGTWVSQAQAALDQLSAATKLDDVARQFGSARHLTEQVLGFPISGGHATKPVIRLVGQLLHHRLGPAVAAEALSLAACAFGAVDTSTVEALLTAALDAPATYCPLRLADRHNLRSFLERQHSTGKRRKALLRLWHREPVENWQLNRLDCLHGPHYWSWVNRDELPTWVWFPSLYRSSEVDQLMHDSPTVDSLMATVLAMTKLELLRLATDPDLFELPQPAIARCLLEATTEVLANPSCPDGLRQRVRYPYDDATLELALRAGRKHWFVPRLRNVLQHARPERLSWLAKRIPEQLMIGLAACGLLTAEHVTNTFVDLDISWDCLFCELKRALNRGYLSDPLPPILQDVLLNHPRAEAVAAIVERHATHELPPGFARQLLNRGNPAISRAVLRHLQPDELTADDASLLQHRSKLTSVCPDIPAVERPRRTFKFSYWAAAPDRLSYPPMIDRLHGAPLPEHPGWTIRLPLTANDLRRNGRHMANCTGQYLDEIITGEVAVLIIDAPDGSTYNASVIPRRSGWRVTEVNSHANGHGQPRWLYSAITTALRRPSDRQHRLAA